MPLDFSDFVLASSPEEAIERRWAEMQKKREAAQEKMAQGVGGLRMPVIPPNIPTQKEDWWAREVKIPGYKIILEQE